MFEVYIALTIIFASVWFFVLLVGTLVILEESGLNSEEYKDFLGYMGLALLAVFLHVFVLTVFLPIFLGYVSYRGFIAGRNLISGIMNRKRYDYW